MHPDITILQEAGKQKREVNGEIWRGISHRSGMAVDAISAYKIELPEISKNVPWSIFPVFISGTFDFNILAV